MSHTADDRASFVSFRAAIAYPGNMPTSQAHLYDGQDGQPTEQPSHDNRPL